MSSDSKASFFRQGGWMVVATFLGGIFMVSVQIAAQNTAVMQSSDSLVFVALLGLLIVFSVPSAALQTVFAQQSAAAVTPEKLMDLTATSRAILRTTFVFFFVVAGAVMIFAVPISDALGVHDPAALRITMLAVWPVLWLPSFKGLLQGLHRFTPLGWLQIMEGFLRLVTFLALVKFLKFRTVGGVFAICAGQYLTTFAAVWWTRDVQWWTKSSGAFSWKAWLIRGLPLTMGMGAYLLMQSLDRVFIKSLFFDVTPVKLYNNAMLVGYAIAQFIGPITTVMFPMIVRSMALSKKSNVLLLTVVTTGGFAVLSAAGCTLFPKLPLAVLHFSLDAAPLVPWYAWSLLPLILANVLVQNLMARERYSVALWLILVPIVYGLTLMAISPILVNLSDISTMAHGVTNPGALREMKRAADFKAMTRVIQTLGLYSTALFGVAVFFSRGAKVASASGRGSAAAR